jgi:hypothetical protein
MTLEWDPDHRRYLDDHLWAVLGDEGAPGSERPGDR